jgi:hypothetical protein
VQVLTTFRVPPGAIDLRFSYAKASADAWPVAGGHDRAHVRRRRSALSPPLLMDDLRTRVVIPTPSRRNPQLQIPFRVQDTAFTPMALGGARRRAAGGLPMAFGMTPGAGARIEAELLGGAGGPVAVEAGPPRVVSDADGVARVVFTLTPRSLAAGEYRLRARLVDGARTIASSELPVVFLAARQLCVRRPGLCLYRSPRGRSRSRSNAPR